MGQKVPDNASEIAQEYLSDYKKRSSGSELIGNMDETPIYFDIPSNTTLDFTGVKTVTSKTTGYEKFRFTVAPTILSTGNYLNTLVVFRGLKKAPKGNFPSDIVVRASKSGTMTSELMVNTYLPEVS